MTGYSKTPLAKKLGLKANMNALILHSPKKYASFFEEVPENVQFNNPGVEQFDFIHLFLTSQDQLLIDFHSLKSKLKSNGILWVSWPKLKMNISTDLNRDFIREFILENGLVDVKVCSVDETWSGLKFVYRLADR
jgi:hypothetical protein